MHIIIERAAILLDRISARVVLLGDGEFDGKELRRRCNELGWEFVVRTAIDIKVYCGVEDVRIDSIEPQQNEEIVFIENASEGDNAVV